MNRGQKDYYKRDYAQAKAEGKPFFPYAIYKDHVVALLAVGLVIALAIIYPVSMDHAQPVNPASTDYVPRPEWYFFFLFELLTIFKGEDVFTPVIMATFIVPNVLMVLLVALPFIDRGPERRPHKRPIAMVTAALTIFSLCYLTYVAATGHGGGGGADELEFSPALSPEAEAGLAIFSTSCTGCHMVKGVGQSGPGPDLTTIGTSNVINADNAKEFLNNPPGSMPPFATFTDEEYQQLGEFLGGLGTEYN